MLPKGLSHFLLYFSNNYQEFYYALIKDKTQQKLDYLYTFSITIEEIKHLTIIHRHSFTVLKQKGINPMQNADPRLNVSQQQQTTATATQPLNNVNLTSGLNTQNNGLNPVVGIGPVGNSAGTVIPGVPGQIGGPTNTGPPIGSVPSGMGGVNPPMGGVTPAVNIGGPPAWLQTELANLQSQQTTLQEQVRQSEQNLAAQHAALMAQQQGRVEDAVRQAQETALQNNAQSTNTDLTAFDTVLQPIIDSCTKDSISAGKAWILQNSITPQSNQVVADHLLKKYCRIFIKLRLLS